MHKVSFTAADRKSIKRNIKQLVKENLGRCIGIQLLYLIPYALLMVMLYTSVFGRAFVLLASSASVSDYQLQAALLQGMNTVWLVIFLMLAITGPLQLGLAHFYISLSRGESVTAGMLLHPFTTLRSFWAGIRMAFTLWLRGLIWSIAPTLIYSTLVIGMVFTIPDEITASIMLDVVQVLYLLAMIPIQLKLQTYQAGWALLAEDDSRGAWQATREGSAVFRGSLFSLFVLNLSFIGWFLLIVVVLGVCALLGTAAASMMSFGMALAVIAAVVVAAVCLLLVLNGFLTAYMQSSFYGMYDFLSAAQSKLPAFDAFAMQQFSYTPVEPSEKEQYGESAPKEPKDASSDGTDDSEE